MNVDLEIVFKKNPRSQVSLVLFGWKAMCYRERRREGGREGEGKRENSQPENPLYKYVNLLIR